MPGTTLPEVGPQRRGATASDSEGVPSPLARMTSIMSMSVPSQTAACPSNPGQFETASTENERYRHLVHLSLDWMWETDTDACYTYVGPQCVAMLGYSPDELSGRPILGTVAPEGFEEARAELIALIRSGKSISGLETTHRQKSGQHVVLEMNAVPLFDKQGALYGYRGLQRDITERKKLEGTQREHERRFRLAKKFGHMDLIEWNIAADEVRRSHPYTDALGISALLCKESGAEFISRMSGDDRLHYLQTLSQLSPSRATFHAAYRELSPKGETRWVESHGQGYFDDDGRLLRVLAVSVDTTASKETEDALKELSGKFIDNQENERRRVARELHDGASQALALIAIELTRITQSIPDLDLSGRLEKLSARLQDVLSDVAQLSHELHPTTLKHLGLSSAIKVLCDEMTRIRGIEIAFTDDAGEQGVSEEVALCLYRVSQEALHNVAKHSKSKCAWVQLSVYAHGIVLTIRDAGVGFNARNGQSGLGLTSMRERLRLIGGALTITSDHLSGTRVEARAPVTAKHTSGETQSSPIDGRTEVSADALNFMQSRRLTAGVSKLRTAA